MSLGEGYEYQWNIKVILAVVKKNVLDLYLYTCLELGDIDSLKLNQVSEQ